MLTQVSLHLTSQLHPALADDHEAVQKATKALVQIYGGIEGLQQVITDSGFGAITKAWALGEPKTLSPSDLHAILGADRLARLANYVGLSQAQTLMGLSGYLPLVMTEELLTA